jgi:hypothetical protein
MDRPNELGFEDQDGPRRRPPVPSNSLISTHMERLEESATFPAGLCRTQHHCKSRACRPAVPAQPGRSAYPAAFRLLPAETEPDRLVPGHCRTGHCRSTYIIDHDSWIYLAWIGVDLILLLAPETRRFFSRESAEAIAG